jgi:hypothetical protein
MAFDINGTTMSGGSSTFSVTTTDGGVILNTDAPGNVYAANWRKTGTTFGNGWTKLDMTKKSSGGYNNYSRFGKGFFAGGSATNFNIFRFTPSNGWTWYYMSMEAHNFAQNGTGYGKWIFPTNGGEGPGYAPGLSVVQTPQGGNQGTTAPTYSSKVNTPPFPDGGYWTAQVQYNVPAYSYVYIILEMDQWTQNPVTSITGKWQVALQ